MSLAKIARIARIAKEEGAEFCVPSFNIPHPEFPTSYLGGLGDLGERYFLGLSSDLKLPPRRITCVRSNASRS